MLFRPAPVASPVRAALALTVSIALGAGQLAAPGQVRAEEPAAQPMLTMPESGVGSMDAEARQHFKLGAAFYEAGRFREAAEEFSEAYRLSKRPELLYNVYVAERDAGRLEAAIEALRGYLAHLGDADDSINLRARLTALEAQVQQRNEEAAARQRELAQANARADEARRAQAARKERVPSIWPWVVMGVGGVAAATGAVTGGLALGKESKLQDDCTGNVCRSSSRGDIDALQRLSHTTDALLVTGAALVVTGLVLRLTHVLDEEREVPPVSVGFGPHQLTAHFARSF